MIHQLLEFLTIICNKLKVWENLSLKGGIGFAFVSHWLKNWHNVPKSITKHSNCTQVITSNRSLKTALNTR